MRLIKTLSLLVFFYMCIKVAAQHPYFYNLNNENGLPTNEIYNLKQDSFGFIWIGSDAGLYRYDGFSYKKYGNSNQNGRSISFLDFDQKNNLWCKNFYGQIYRVDHDSLKVVYQINTSNPSAPFFTLGNNQLWLIDNDSVKIIDNEGLTINSINVPEEIRNQQLIGIKYFNNKVLVFTKNFDVYQIDKKLRFKKIKPNQLTNKNYRNIQYYISKNKLFLLCEYEKTELEYDLATIDEELNINSFHNNITNNNNRIYSIYVDQKNVWLTSPKGVSKIDTTQKLIQNQLFKNQKISSMLIDKEGMLWFSSLHQGIFVLPTLDVIKLNTSNSNLKENQISVVKKLLNGNLLIGTYSGNLFEIDTTYNYKLTLDIKKEAFFNVKTILDTKNFIVVSRGRLCVFDKKNNIQYFPKYSHIRDLEIMNDTLYLVFPGFINKVWTQDLINKRLDKSIIINNQGGKAIAYNENDTTLYFSLSNGTFQLNKNGEWNEVLAENKKIISSSVTCKNNETWIASVNNGVYHIDINKRIHHISNKNLLLENDVRLIHISNQHTWIATEKYLHRLNNKTNQVSVFDNSIGINVNDINSIESWRDKLILATNKGLIIIPENLNPKSYSKPSVKVENLFENDKPIKLIFPIELKYNNSNLRINLSSISFKSKANYFYSYQLKGLENKYSLIPASNNFIQFSHLPYGKYTLIIKAISSSGIESNEILIPIHIAKPYWLEWWFILISLIFTFCLFAIVFRTRVKIIKRKADYKTKLIQSQLTAIKSQMNPHFLFNTLNSLQDLIVKQDVKMSNFYLSKFSSLLRKVLETSSKNEISIKDEIEILTSYLELEKLRFGDDFSYIINLDDSIEEDDFKIHPMLIQPFVENAIKHGLLHKKGEKKLSISFKLNEDVTCIIEDNGIGRKKSEEIKKRKNQNHQSFATQASEKRIDLLNSTGFKKYSFTIIDKQNDSGTQVIVKIPYNL